MTSRVRVAARRLRALALRWVEDRSGATLVQFIAVLPVFVLVIFGLWSMYTVYSAHQTVCEASWSAARYLQVEGPLFPTDDPAYEYPDGWQRVATEIVNTELKSHAMLDLYPADTVEILPDRPRIPPKDVTVVNPDTVKENWFFVHATKGIDNPLGVFFPEDLKELTIQCRATGFYEVVPLRPTTAPASGACPRCPLPPRCTPGPEPNPTSTPDTSECPCPVCRN